MSEKCKPRLKFVGGQWYAFGKNTKPGRQLLVPAITFCKRLNRKKQHAMLKAREAA